MIAEQSLRDGNLDKALTELEGAVRDDPSNSRYRVFLFQLLCVRGEWNRALTQLEVVKDMDASTIPMVQTYREAIQCEGLRADVFAGRRAPLIFGEPEEWIAWMLEALKLSSQGRDAEANEMRQKSLEAAPASRGHLKDAEENSVPFDWIFDADARFGPMLEVIMQGKYYWIPFDRIFRVDFDAPTDLRDLVWTPAHLQWTNGGLEVGLVPTRYAGTESSDDNALRLSRTTSWAEHGENVFLGTGQRTLATDVDDYPILSIRQLAFDVEVAPPEPAAGSPPGSGQANDSDATTTDSPEQE